MSTFAPRFDARHQRVLGVVSQKPARFEQFERVLGQFEGFCTMTQSVGQGIPIQVRVLDADGIVLKS